MYWSKVYIPQFFKTMGNYLRLTYKRTNKLVLLCYIYLCINKNKKNLFSYICSYFWSSLICVYGCIFDCPCQGPAALYWVFDTDSIVTAAGTIMTKLRRKIFEFCFLKYICHSGLVWFVLLVFPDMCIYLHIWLSHVKVPTPYIGSSLQTP